MEHFNMYEAIARSHNEAHPQGTYVTSADVRQEMLRLIEIYGKFKYLGEPEMSQGHTPCSFCNREYPQIRGLIAGPGGVHICFQCIEKCRELAEELQRTGR